MSRIGNFEQTTNTYHAVTSAAGTEKGKEASKAQGFASTPAATYGSASKTMSMSYMDSFAKGYTNVMRHRGESLFASEEQENAAQESALQESAQTATSSDAGTKTSSYRGKSVQELRAQMEKAESGLSDKAKELLKQLREKYGNMEFMVSGYDSEEEAGAIMGLGTKEFSVLIEPELLEKMAADDEVRDKYMGIIEESTQGLADAAKQLEGREDIRTLGMTVSEDGKVSYYAILEEMTESRKQWLESEREQRAEEQKEKKEQLEEAREARLEKMKEKREERKEKPEEARQSASVSGTADEKTRWSIVTADSLEELLEKLKG